MPDVYDRFSTPPAYNCDCTKGGPSLTVQSFKDECDINRIMARYEKTGILPDPGAGARREAIFGDFTSVGDFQACQERIAVAKQEFASLPALVRERFGNRVEPLLEFLQDEKNRSEAEELGLVEKKVVEAPVVPSATPVG